MIYKPGSFSIHDICRNIIVEDPRPTLQHFFIMMEGTLPWGGCEDHHRDPGDLFGLTFQVRLVDSTSVKEVIFLFGHSQNITITAWSTLDEPEVLWGMESGRIYDLIFDNVVIADEKIETLDQFYHNEYVSPLIVP